MTVAGKENNELESENLVDQGKMNLWEVDKICLLSGLVYL